MKIPIVLCTALALMFASPALADIVYTPIDPGEYAIGFGIGIYDPANPAVLNSVYVTSGSGAPQSATFQFSFAIHNNVSQIPIFADRLHFSFVYDNSSLEVLGAQPVGPWQSNNYAGQPWPNSSHGIIAVNSLSQAMTEPGAKVTFVNSTVVPFLHVTLHVKSAQFSQINEFGITLPGYGPNEGYGLTFFNSGVTVVPPGSWVYFGGAIHEIPEPATLTLLGAAFCGLAGRVVARRRRVD
jgi:hypothetical protein